MNIETNKMEDNEIFEVMFKKNVVISKIGTKIKNGIDTGEPCIVVGVKEKIAKENLQENDLIPKFLSNGVITDVIEFPQIFAITGCSEIPTDSWRPIRGGVSAIRSGQTACTLGVVVKDNTDKKLVALTNNHCAGVVYDPNYAVPSNGNLDTNGEANLQPSPLDGGLAEDQYGVIKRTYPIKFGPSGVNLIDASISTITAANPMTDIINVGAGPFEFEIDKNKYASEMMVAKNGRTTCYTSGFKTDYLINVNVAYKNSPSSNEIALFTNQIYITGQGIVEGGDSGSVIIANIDNKDKIIGLLFAGGNNIGIANHIYDVATGLNISGWDGSIIVPYNTGQTITLNGKTYQRLQDTYDEVTHTL